MNSLRAVIAALFVIALSFPSGAQETSTKEETSYQPSADEAEELSVLATRATEETQYNPLGTNSSGYVAFLSNDRESDEFPGLLQGMQQASQKILRNSLHVAPNKAKSLMEQYQALSDREISIWVVHSPDPSDASGFIDMADKLDLQVVVLSDTLKNSPGSAPIVAFSDYSEALRAGEEAIRRVGNKPVTVAFVSRFTDEDFEDQNSDAAAYFRMFKRPFGVSAPLITVERLRPDHQQGLLPSPEVIVAFTDDDSRHFLPLLASSFEDSKIVMVGESDKLRKAVDQGKVDVRIRPNYGAILSTALRELSSQTNDPTRISQIVPPTADFAPEQ